MSELLHSWCCTILAGQPVKYIYVTDTWVTRSGAALKSACMTVILADVPRCRSMLDSEDSYGCHIYDCFLTDDMSRQIPRHPHLAIAVTGRCIDTYCAVEAEEVQTAQLPLSRVRCSAERL